MQLLKIEMTKNSRMANLLSMVEDNKHQAFANRLNELIFKRKISITDLAKKAGVTYEMARRYTIGTAKPRTPTMLKLANALSVDPSYLEYGISHNIQDDEPLKDSYRVEVLDIEASAGNGVVARDEFIETIRSIEYSNDEAKLLFHGRPSENIKMIAVNGDSMSGTFEPRDQIFVDVSVNFFDGDGIYIFAIDDKLYIKRLQLQFDRIAIISDNKKYETWHMGKDNIGMIRIIAKVLVSQSRAYKFHG